MKVIRSLLRVLSWGAPALLGCGGGVTVLGAGMGAGGAGGSAPASSTSTSTSSSSGAGGSCAAPALLCAGVCVDPSSDDANCGSCGHSCQGGTCQSAMCQPVTLASGQAYPWVSRSTRPASTGPTGKEGARAAR